MRDRVRVLLQDYRDAAGQYDAVVAVEMIEAVGADYWPVFFHTLDKRLAPGGQLLSTEAIEDQVRRHTSLRITGRRSLGSHYARTLAAWRARFGHARDDVATLGFDDTFRRMWEFYLAYSEAGFRAGYLDVWQVQLTKSAG